MAEVVTRISSPFRIKKSKRLGGSIGPVSGLVHWRPDRPFALILCISCQSATLQYTPRLITRNINGRLGLAFIMRSAPAAAARCDSVTYKKLRLAMKLHADISTNTETHCTTCVSSSQPTKRRANASVTDSDTKWIALSSAWTPDRSLLFLDHDIVSYTAATSRALVIRYTSMLWSAGITKGMTCIIILVELNACNHAAWTARKLHVKWMLWCRFSKFPCGRSRWTGALWNMWSLMEIEWYWKLLMVWMQTNFVISLFNNDRE